MRDRMLSGHLAAFLTILVWGTTFISTKVLLVSFTPVEILFIRFLIGFFALLAVCPQRLRLKEPKQEWYFVAAGLCGVTLYYLFENIALTYTTASNVGVIISVAPFFTAVFGWLFLGEEKPGVIFLLGFVVAMAGISLISFAGGSGVQINPLGDLLAFVAAVIWAAYSAITKKISGLGYSTLLTTRRTFFYGLLFMVPALGFLGFDVTASQLLKPVAMGNLLFLGFGASALCFVTWNLAVRRLGPVKTSVYIYMVPVITAATSAAILQERMTAVTVWGILLTLAGLLLSDYRGGKEKGSSPTGPAQCQEGGRRR